MTEQRDAAEDSGGKEGPRRNAARATSRMTFRRCTNLLLLAVGGLLAAWALRHYSADPQRAAVVAALAVFGLCLNLTGLARASLDLRPWLRVLACVVGLLVLVTVAGRWYVLTRQVIPAIPKANPEMRAAFALAAGNLLWVGAALAYIMISVPALPCSRDAKSVAPR